MRTSCLTIFKCRKMPCVDVTSSSEPGAVADMIGLPNADHGQAGHKHKRTPCMETYFSVQPEALHECAPQEPKRTPGRIFQRLCASRLCFSCVYPKHNNCCAIPAGLVKRFDAVHIIGELQMMIYLVRFDAHVAKRFN
jgi:hypothetical protein